MDNSLITFGGVLTDAQRSELERVLGTFDQTQLAWVTGYLTAKLGSGVPGIGIGIGGQSQVQAAPAGKKLTILYGSQSGNAKKVAKMTAQSAVARGFDAKITCMSDYNTSLLKKEENVFVVTSTHGEGVPPDNAIRFHKFIHSKRAPKMEKMNFSVLALGDASYQFFCKTGADFDVQFEKLGGNRVADRVDCDLDYDDLAEEWAEEALTKLEAVVGKQASHAVAAPAAGLNGKSLYDKKNPFQAPVLDKINLNGRGSSKETLHIELSLEESGLTYEPGDAIGVFAPNNPVLVQELISSLNLKGDEQVTVGKQDTTLLDALTTKLEITVLTRPLVAKYEELTQVKGLKDLLEDNEKFQEYVQGRDLRDLLRDYPGAAFGAQDLVSMLRKLPSRLYSIASSPEAHPDEVHILAGVVRYDAHGIEREGVCTSFLADRLGEDDSLSVFIDPNENFKLPANPDTPMIMIGPGTGIAPFRSFIEHRDSLGAQGKNWLFFGDQHFTTDFLYQTELLNYLKSGVLTNLDVAFSRDQEEKIYVQHRMLERKRELYAWIQEGAYIYVCGDEGRMAHDVHQTLIDIVSSEGAMSPENAQEYIEKLQQDQRYQRDVY